MITWGFHICLKLFLIIYGFLDQRIFYFFHCFYRYGSVHFDGTVLKSKLVDMPCIVDVLKTIDKKTFYKTGNISQVRFYAQFIYTCENYMWMCINQNETSFNMYFRCWSVVKLEIHSRRTSAPTVKPSSRWPMPLVTLSSRPQGRDSNDCGKADMRIHTDVRIAGIFISLICIESLVHSFIIFLCSNSSA